MRRAIGFLITAFYCSTALADISVYKCTVRGVTAYSDIPCTSKPGGGQTQITEKVTIVAPSATRDNRNDSAFTPEETSWVVAVPGRELTRTVTTGGTTSTHVLRNPSAAMAEAVPISAPATDDYASRVAADNKTRECRSLKDALDGNASAARLPQSAPGQDYLRRERERIYATRSKLRCN